MDAGGAHRVIDGSIDAFETESGRLGAALVYAPVEDATITIVSIESVAGAFKGARYTTLLHCKDKQRERERKLSDTLNV